MTDLRFVFAHSVFAAALLGTVFAAHSTHPARGWPVVAPLDTAVNVPSLARKTRLRVPVYDRHGQLAYTLVCRSGSEPEVQEGDDDNALWVPAVFLCRMNPGAREDEQTILVRDESPLWYTEGWVRYVDLKELARRQRVFRLRGFELVLTFEHVVIDHGQPKRLDVRVRLRPDPRITTAWMDGPGARMCRNWRDSTRLGAWDPCPEQ